MAANAKETPRRLLTPRTPRPQALVLIDMPEADFDDVFDALCSSDEECFAEVACTRRASELFPYQVLRPTV
jgi:hypothetical protein